LKEGVTFTSKISTLLNLFQKERVLALQTLQNPKLQPQLNRSFTTTSQLLKELLHYSSHLPLKHSHTILNSISLNHLYSQLQKKDNFTTLTAYSQINQKLLSSLSSTLTLSTNPYLTRSILAYDFFLHLKEKASIEGVLGEMILKSKVALGGKREKSLFQKVVNEQEFYHKLFREFAPSSFFKSYEELFREGDFKSLKVVEKAILEGDLKRLIDSKSWAESVALKMEKLQAFEDYLEAEVINSTNSSLSKALSQLWLYLLLFIAIFAIFFLTTAQILKLLKKKSELKGILDRYVISSTTDLKGNITDVSEAFCKISGYSKEELIGKPHNIIRHPDMPKEVFKQMWKTISKGKVWEGEVKNRKKNGGSYWVRAVISPLYDERGKRIGYTAVRQDITDKKKIEELNKTLEERVAKEVQKSREKDKKMLQQSRLAQMGEMLSMIAHQWRQPLSAISSTASALNMKAKLGSSDNEIVAQLTQKILSYTQHLSQTIDDFRDFFKSDKEKRITTWKEMVESVMGIIETSLENKNIKLIKEIESDTLFYTHPNQVKQVILNLIKNAEDVLLEREIKNPTITLTAKGNLLIVKDNAGGIEEKILPKIFDPYFSTKLEKDGTGLGLYMSKTIIQEHCNGNLWVYNDEEGAVFVIELPPSNESAKERKAS